MAAARVVTAFVLLAGASGIAYSQDRVEASARTLEQRLHAPCCRDQMLEAHDSEPVRRLRSTIRERFRAGASSDAVEQALIAEFGPSIIAIPKDRDPRAGLSTLIVALLALAVAGICVLGIRWVRRADRGQPASALGGDAPPDEIDAQLDRALSRLDE